MRLSSSGQKINLPSVFRREASISGGAKEINSKVFEHTHFPEKRDYAITLLVDLSGSMRGEKMIETFKGVVLLAEVLNRLGVRVSIVGFSYQPRMFKDFQEELDDSVRGRISGMQPAGDTYLGQAMTFVSERMKNLPNREKFVITITDGDPSDNAKIIIDYLLSKSDLKLIGLGLGEDTSQVSSLFPWSQSELPAERLPETLAKLLEEVIKNPNKFR